jgi:hypothetical protein
VLGLYHAIAVKTPEELFIKGAFNYASAPYWTSHVQALLWAEDPNSAAADQIINWTRRS